MNEIFAFIKNYLQKFLGFFIPAIFREGQDLVTNGKNIQLRYLFSDLASMLLNAKMLLVFNLLALLVFTVLPAGKDVLLIVIEEVSRYRFGNYIWLMTGVTTWSVISEYAVRYSIYVTDNSGHSLPEERIRFRKSLQKRISNAYLLFPFIVVAAGLAINYFQYSKLFVGFSKYFGFGLPAISLLFIFSGLSRYYLNINYRNDLRKKIFPPNAGIKNEPVQAAEAKQPVKKPSNSIFQFLLLPPQELEWAARLLGIYNNYVYTLPTEENFDPPASYSYIRFAEFFNDVDDERAKRFPQSENLYEEARVPEQFLLMQFKKDEGDIRKTKNESEKCEPNEIYSGREDAKSRYKWIYKIPVKFLPGKSNNDFYKILHNQLRAIVLVSICIITMITLMPARWLDIIGPPGLVCFAFAAWSGIYAGLLFVDFAILRNAAVSVRFILFVMLIVSSYFNNDHPYRHDGASFPDNRPRLEKHFQDWCERYKKDSSNCFVTIPSATDSVKRFPVIFICAEGGALRTGAYASFGLGYLQDTLMKLMKYDMRKSIYAFSAVSGGSVGCSLFNAMAYLQDSAQLRPPYNFDSLSKNFYDIDFLSPVLGRMFYSEIVQLFLPIHINYFDRAIALETAWERGYLKVIRHNAPSIFNKSYQNIYSRPHLFPAFFINTTEVESGLQCFISNVKPSGFLKNDERDLLNDSMYHKIDHDLLYSTAINFSTRFPLISPAAAITASDERTLHYIDGGYVENTGAGTMLEILRVLKPLIDSNKVMPFVAVLKFSDDANDDFEQVRFGNELTEIVSGIYNTRLGRTDMALGELERYTENELHGKYIPLSLEKTSNDVPTNWALSRKSVQRIQEDIEKKWKERYSNRLKCAFFLDTCRQFYKRLNDTGLILRSKDTATRK